MTTACWCQRGVWTRPCWSGTDWLFQRLTNQVSVIFEKSAFLSCRGQEFSICRLSEWAISTVGCVHRSKCKRFLCCSPVQHNRCHNPHNSLTPQRLFAAKTPFQLDSIFCLHSITALSKPIHFVVMKRSGTERTPWIKSKTNPGLNIKKSMNFIVIEGKISLKVTRARGCESTLRKQSS